MLLKKTMLYLVLLILFFSCKNKKQEQAAQKSNKPSATMVDIMIASTASISNIIEVNGTVIPLETVNINPELSGRLVYLYAPDGAKVSKGTILAKLNDAELQATLGKTKILLGMAQKSEERLRKLIAINGINQADYDMALNQVNGLKADLSIIQAQIDKTILRAPFTGVLGLRQISPGAYITPSTTITTLQQIDQVKIDFNVPELYTYLIKSGNQVQIQTNQSDTKRIARIVATDPQMNATNRNLRVRAFVVGSTIAPGSFVKVLLESGNGKKSISVPTSAIIPDARAKKIIVIKNGEGVFVEVETGIRGAGLAEITNGIFEGDSIVVTGVLFVRPNQPVKIRSIKKLNDFIK